MEDLKSLSIDAPKYDGKTDIAMWQLTVRDALIQQRLDDMGEDEAKWDEWYILS